MSKHTPGPWRLEIRHGVRVWGPETMLVAECRGWGYLTGVGALNLPYDEAAAIQDANGRLITAAPDLLEACKSLFSASHFDHFAVRMSDSEMDALTMMKAAITKAEEPTP